MFLLHLTSPLDLGQSGEDSRREAAATMLLFGLTQRHKKPSSRERGTARVLASVKTRHGRKLTSIRVLSKSLRDRRLRSARKSIWCSGICCKRSGSTSQLGAHSQHFLSRCMNIRSAPRSGPRVLERLRTAVSASAVFLSDEGWRPRRKSNFDTTRLATRKASVDSTAAATLLC